MQRNMNHFMTSTFRARPAAIASSPAKVRRMIKPMMRAGLVFGLLTATSLAASEKRATKQPDRQPISFTWKSEYWPKGLRQWSQTAPNQWTEKYEDGTADTKFRVLGRLSMADGCAGLHLRSMAEPLEAFIPGSSCSSKWLLFRWVSIYTSKPQWVGQAEIQDIQYARAAAPSH